MACAQPCGNFDYDVIWIDRSGCCVIFVNTLPWSANRDCENCLAFPSKNLMLCWKGFCHQCRIAKDSRYYEPP